MIKNLKLCAPLAEKMIIKNNTGRMNYWSQKNNTKTEVNESDNYLINKYE